jgi:hypothetical protein
MNRLSRADILIMFGYKAGTKLYNLLYSSCANFCCIVKNCLGISSSGSSSLVLNQQGDWISQNNNPNVQTVISAATVTPTFENDLVVITAQAAGLTLANPTGTWVQGKDLVIRIKDNGTARSIAYDTKYRAIGVTLPTTTVINKTTYLGVVYNLTDDTFDIIGVTTQA